MKKLIAIFILVFIIGSMLSGCYITDFDKGNNNPAGSNPGETSDPDQNITPDNPTDPGNTETEKNEDPTANLKVGTSVGDLFRDLTLETLDGGSVSTADYRGKIVIINIWATRCPPCKEELPDFNRIASEYAGEVVIIAAHEDYTKSAAPSYVETNFPDSKIIFAYDTPRGDAYYAAGGNGYIPQTAIIDQNGVIIYSNYGILSYERLVSIIEATK